MWLQYVSSWNNSKSSVKEIWRVHIKTLNEESAVNQHKILILPSELQLSFSKGSCSNVNVKIIWSTHVCMCMLSVTLLMERSERFCDVCDLLLSWSRWFRWTEDSCWTKSRRCWRNPSRSSVQRGQDHGADSHITQRPTAQRKQEVIQWLRRVWSTGFTRSDMRVSRHSRHTRRWREAPVSNSTEVRHISHHTSHEFHQTEILMPCVCVCRGRYSQ